jgi:hypothetical protein
MTEQERSAAIERFQEHEAQTRRRVAEQERHERDDLATWKKTTLPTINHAIQGVSEDFARRGSPFLFSTIPVQSDGSAFFRVKSTGGLRLLSKLQFDLTADGQVIATALVGGAYLPSSVPMKDVTREWVEQAAEKALIAMINAA